MCLSQEINQGERQEMLTKLKETSKQGEDKELSYAGYTL